MLVDLEGSYDFYYTNTFVCVQNTLITFKGGGHILEDLHIITCRGSHSLQSSYVITKVDKIMLHANQSRLKVARKDKHTLCM